jgi:tetratricopeptide (TPR) repeat protein
MGNKQTLKDGIVFLVLIIIGVILYYRVIHFGFIDWDDNFYVVHNQYITAITLSNIGYIFTHYYYSGTYQPLQLLTYMLIYSIDKLNPMWFHIINATFFIIDAILVYLFVKRLNTQVVALLTALLFLISPVNVDSAAWVSELKNTQSLLFILASIITYDLYLRSNKWKWYTISLIFFIVALLTKQTVATMVILLFLLEWFVYKKPFSTVLFKQLPFYILSIIAVPVFVLGQVTMISQSSFYEPSLYYRIITAIANIAGVLEYPNKIILPINVASFYPPYFILGFFTPRFLISLLALIIIVWVGLVLYKKRSIGFFWLAWYFVNMIPAFGIVHVPFYTNWYLFLPCIGVYALLSMAIENIYNSISIKSYTFVLIGIITVVFGFISWQRIETYKDDLHLWKDGIKRFPNYYFAYEMYARALVNKNDISEAIEYAKRSLKLNPYNAKVLSGLGMYYLSNKEYAKAFQYIKDALKYDPWNASYMYLLATYYKEVGDQKKYESEMRRCVLQNPYELGYVNELIQFYVDKNETDKAIELMKEVISAHPMDPVFYNVLGYIYLKYTNNIYEAKRLFERSLVMDPHQEKAHELKRLINDLTQKLQ